MNGIVEIDLLLAMAPLLVVPLGLSMFGWTDPQAERLRGMAAQAAPFAGAAGALSIFPRNAGYQENLGGLLAAVWLAISLMIAISALAELVRTRPSSLEPYLPIAACAYLLVGAVWLVLFRAGIRPFEVPIEIVELTAVHFHYAGFAGPVLAAQAARWLRALPGKWHRLAAFSGLGVVLAMVMVAVGIGGSPLMEVEGSIIMAVSLVALAAGTTLIAFRLTVGPRILLLISSAAVWMSMALAVQYAFGQYTVTGAVSVRDMARTHGMLNLAFTLCGLLGWKLAAGKAKLAAQPPPAGEQPVPEEDQRAPEEPADQPGVER